MELVVGAAVGEEEEVVAVAFPLVALLSSVCHPTSVHQCTLGQVLIPCCLQGPWEGLEEADLPIPVLACLHSSNMDRVVTHLTAHLYLVAVAPEGLHTAPCHLWEEAWVLG